MICLQCIFTFNFHHHRHWRICVYLYVCSFNIKSGNRQSGSHVGGHSITVHIASINHLNKWIYWVVVFFWIVIHIIKLQVFRCLKTSNYATCKIWISQYNRYLEMTWMYSLQLLNITFNNAIMEQSIILKIHLTRISNLYLSIIIVFQGYCITSITQNIPNMFNHFHI